MHTEFQHLKMTSHPSLVSVQIGSFPQTAEIRRLRLQNKKGLLPDAEYAKLIAGHIGFAVGLQEAMDIDVLVARRG